MGQYSLGSEEDQKVLNNSYIIGETLGQGTFGKVKLGIHIFTGEKVAIKILEKVKMQDEEDIKRVTREIQILKQIRHPHIIQLLDLIETEEELYLITEYASGGELFDYIVHKNRLTEHQSCEFFQQLLSGIEYLHTHHGIVHRDLKPENLLLDCNHNLKIVDFGLSNIYQKDQLLVTACGSPCYAAPEMIAGQKYQGLKVDIWSCGVVLYAMVCGYLPFEDKDTAALYQKIMLGEYEWQDQDLQLSYCLSDLMKQILCVNPEERISVLNIIQHPWCQKFGNNGQEYWLAIEKQSKLQMKGKVAIDQEIVERLRATSDIDIHYLTYSLQNAKINTFTAGYYILLLKKLDQIEKIKKTFRKNSSSLRKSQSYVEIYEDKTTLQNSNIQNNCNNYNNQNVANNFINNIHDENENKNKNKQQNKYINTCDEMAPNKYKKQQNDHQQHQHKQNQDKYKQQAFNNQYQYNEKFNNILDFDNPIPFQKSVVEIEQESNINQELNNSNNLTQFQLIDTVTSSYLSQPFPPKSQQNKSKKEKIQLYDNNHATNQSYQQTKTNYSHYNNNNFNTDKFYKNNYKNKSAEKNNATKQKCVQNKPQEKKIANIKPHTKKQNHNKSTEMSNKQKNRVEKPAKSKSIEKNNNSVKKVYNGKIKSKNNKIELNMNKYRNKSPIDNNLQKSEKKQIISTLENKQNISVEQKSFNKSFDKKSYDQSFEKKPYFLDKYLHDKTQQKNNQQQKQGPIKKGKSNIIDQSRQNDEQIQKLQKDNSEQIQFNRDQDLLQNIDQIDNYKSQFQNDDEEQIQQLTIEKAEKEEQTNDMIITQELLLTQEINQNQIVVTNSLYQTNNSVQKQKLEEKQKEDLKQIIYDSIQETKDERKEKEIKRKNYSSALQKRSKSQEQNKNLKIKADQKKQQLQQKYQEQQKLLEIHKKHQKMQQQKQQGKLISVQQYQTEVKLKRKEKQQQFNKSVYNRTNNRTFNQMTKFIQTISIKMNEKSNEKLNTYRSINNNANNNTNANNNYKNDESMNTINKNTCKLNSNGIGHSNKKQVWKGQFSILQVSNKSEKQMLEEVNRVAKVLRLELKKRDKYSVVLTEYQKENKDQIEENSNKTKENKEQLNNLVFVVEVVKPANHHTLNCLLFHHQSGCANRFNYLHKHILSTLII